MTGKRTVGWAVRLSPIRHLRYGPRGTASICKKKAPEIRGLDLLLTIHC